MGRKIPSIYKHKQGLEYCSIESGVGFYSQFRGLMKELDCGVSYFCFSHQIEKSMPRNEISHNVLDENSPEHC